MGVILLIIFLFLLPVLIGALSSINNFHLINLSEIDNMKGADFEKYVAELLSKRGYITEVTKASGDQGVDVIASFGAQRYAIQVKRQKNNVSRRAVSDAVAGAIHYGCTASMVVTNAFFTNGAKELAGTTGCILVDRTDLSNWISDLNRKAAINNPPDLLESKTAKYRKYATVVFLILIVFSLIGFLAHQEPESDSPSDLKQLRVSNEIYMPEDYPQTFQNGREKQQVLPEKKNIERTPEEITYLIRKEKIKEKIQFYEGCVKWRVNSRDAKYNDEIEDLNEKLDVLNRELKELEKDEHIARTSTTDP